MQTLAIATSMLILASTCLVTKTGEVQPIWNDIAQEMRDFGVCKFLRAQNANIVTDAEFKKRVKWWCTYGDPTWSPPFASPISLDRG